MRAGLSVAVLGTVTLVSVLAGCGKDAGSSAVDIDAGDTSCDVARTEFEPGEVTFSVTNSGEDITEVYVYGKQGDDFSQIIAEVENIGPGVSREMTVDLEAGDYQITCKPGMVDDNVVNVPITVRAAGPGDEPTTPVQSITDPPTDPPKPTQHDPGTPSDSTAQRARKAQIPAAELPGFNDEWSWTAAGSGPGSGRELPSVCLQSSLTAIGAVTEYRTDYGSSLDDNSSAVQFTAVFPDEQTAVTASDVLDAWHRNCTRHATQDLGLEQVDVSNVSPVSTTVGPGMEWLTTYRPVAGDPDAAWFQAQGFVRDGDTLTYLIITTAAQDYNYEQGQEPVSLALEVAGHYLAETR